MPLTHVPGTFDYPKMEKAMNIFAPEQITKMKAALAQATESTMPDTATQALMAECILQSAASGVRSQEEFRKVAAEAAKNKAT